MSWNIDTSHTQINFSVRHMMLSTVRGRFEKFSGSVDLNETTPSLSTVNVQIDTASIFTNEEKRDGHLRSADFLDSEKYPFMTFKSTRVVQQDATHAQVYGDLTIRGVSKEVKLEVEFLGKQKAPWGVTVAGFSGKTAISRKEWGLTWNMALETGGVLVGDEIKIDIELELVEQPEIQVAGTA